MDVSLVQMTTRTTISPERCTATAKSTGEQCKRRPHPGSNVCVKHGAGSPAVRKAAKRRLALGEARAELDRLGVPIEVEASDAMVQMVWEAAGNVAYLRERLSDLDDPIAEVAVPTKSGEVYYREEVNLRVVMYDAERERLVKWAKACRDAGVEEHRVALAEKQGELLAEVLRSLLTGLQGTLIAAGLAEQVVRRVFASDVPPLVRAALTSASGEGR